MLLTPTALIPKIATGEIIQKLATRELTAPEGVGFDLRIASISKLGSGRGSLRVETRRTPPSVPLIPDDQGLFILEPRTSYLATTVETFSLPTDLAALFFPRSTLFRSGVSFESSVLPPGYAGPMTFAICNQHSEPFELELNARFAHVVFMSVMGDVNGYRGQWQGGRISQDKNEDQV